MYVDGAVLPTNLAASAPEVSLATSDMTAADAQNRFLENMPSEIIEVLQWMSTHGLRSPPAKVWRSSPGGVESSCGVPSGSRLKFFKTLLRQRQKG
jgi:hypothetical protein